MRVLVACECSCVVRDAFAARGHDAWSCDLQPAERGGQHIQGDAIEAAYTQRWDLMIAHPECTYLANSGAKHLYAGMKKENGPDGDRWARMGKAAEGALLSERGWADAGEAAWNVLRRDAEVTDWSGAERGKFCSPITTPSGEEGR